MRVSVPRYDEQAEESVLGAILLPGSASAIEAVARVLEGCEFYRESHRTIFRAALDLHGEGGPVDPITLADFLYRRGDLDAVGGKAKIAELAALVPAASNAAHYAEIVARLASDRERVEVGLGLRDGTVAAGEAIERLRRVARGDRSWLERASDLLAEPDPGPTPFVVDELLVEGAVGMIVGAPKLGKTWIVLDLAVAIVTGTDALGRFPVAEPGPVMVVVEESGRDALHRRLAALARGRGIDGAALADLHLAPNRGVRLDDARWRQRLLAAASEIRPRAVFLDPLARLKGDGVDENSQRDVAPVLRFLRDLRDASGAAVVFVHHSGHGEGGRARGSSDLESYWESRLVVGRGDDGQRHLTASHREGERDSYPHDYRLISDTAARTVRLAIREPDRGSEATPGPTLVETVVAYVTDHPGLSKTAITDAVKGRDRAIIAAINAAALGGDLRIEAGDRGAQHVYPSTTPSRSAGRAGKGSSNDPCPATPSEIPKGSLGKGVGRPLPDDGNDCAETTVNPRPPSGGGDTERTPPP